MKLVRVLCALALVAGLTAVAYAETQSVKVSGDLAIRSFLRDAWDLQKSPNEPIVRTGLTSSTQTWVMSTTEVQIDADLTDNVSACVRLANERDWNVGTKATTQVTPFLTEYATQVQVENDVGVEKAYVKLKEFIYSPLTLTIGRQDLWFGKGLIVGANQRFDAAWYAFGALANQPNPGFLAATVNGINAPEYSCYNSFDALKAVLDYNPWTITAISAKIWEYQPQDDDDVNLWGTNIGYKFDQYKADVEGYWFWKQDRSPTKWNAFQGNNDVHTFGIRASADPIDAVTVNGEVAWQGGGYISARRQTNRRSRNAWAADLGGEWRYLADKWSWKPKLAAEYIFYSGNQEEENVNTVEGDYNGWDRMYRGKYDSAIREWVGTYYATARYPFVASPNRNDPKTADASYQNQHQVVLSGTVQPIESLTLKGQCNLFWAHHDISLIAADGSLRGNAIDKKYLGTEFDLQAIWDYTEDVSFGLLGGWFYPGQAYGDLKDKSATDIVGTVKVSF